MAIEDSEYHCTGLLPMPTWVLGWSVACLPGYWGEEFEGQVAEAPRPLLPLSLPTCRQVRVTEQHSNSHGPDTPGDRRNPARALLGRLKVHVPNQSLARLS